MNPKIPALIVPQFFAQKNVVVYEIVGMETRKTHLGELAISFSDDGTEIFLVNIYVEEYFREHGVATQVLSNLLNFAKVMGVSSIRLFVPIIAEDAQRLYRKFGFESTDKVLHFCYEMVWRNTHAK